MTIAKTISNTDGRCSGCGTRLEFSWSTNPLNWSIPNRSGVWVHRYAPQWGKQMTCDPQKAREVSDNERRAEEFRAAGSTGAGTRA